MAKLAPTKKPRTIEVHQSEMKCYLHCRQQHFYRYVEKIIRRKRPKPLVRGTIIHRMVELHQIGENPFAALSEAETKYKKLFREEQEEYGDLIGDIRRLMTSYFDWYKRDPIKAMKVNGKPAVELKFKVDFAPGVVLAGRIDRVGESRDTRSWLEDTKSHNTLPEGGINATDYQTVLYHWAFGIQYKVKLDGIAWNYIRYKPPTIPKLLGSGELSKAKNIDTMWSVYREAIEDNKLDYRDYDDMRKILEGREATFFIRSYLPVNTALSKSIIESARTVALEIRDLPKPVRHLGRHCGWCEYSLLCNAEMRGLDSKYMRKVDYMPKEDEDEQGDEE